MPPKRATRHGSRPEEVGVLRAWIDQGAVWPDDRAQSRRHDPLDWWSLKPIVRSAVPETRNRATRSPRMPIDAFIRAKLAEKNLAPSPEADRPHALPPPLLRPHRPAADARGSRGVRPIRDPQSATPHSSRSSTSCSPPRATANAGRGTGSTSSTTATRTATTRTSRARTPGRIATTSSARSTRTSRTRASCRSRSPATCSFPARATASRRSASSPPGRGTSSATSKCRRRRRDGKIARHLDRDDMVANTMGTFTSLTVHCAQCHNHKFDPIPQEDYYSPAGRLRRARSHRPEILPRRRAQRALRRADETAARRGRRARRRRGAAAKKGGRAIRRAHAAHRRRIEGRRAKARQHESRLRLPQRDLESAGRGEVGAGGPRPAHRRSRM